MGTLYGRDGRVMERHEFPPGEEPTVYTSDLCEIFGGCEKCPGSATAEECQGKGQTQFIYGEQRATGRPVYVEPQARIFCTHWCHRKAAEA